MRTQTSALGGIRRLPTRKPTRRVRGDDKPIPTMGPNIPVLSKPENSVITTKKEKDQIIAETIKKEAKLPLLKITKSVISLYSWEEMERLAGAIQVKVPAYSDTGSVNDPRMGVVSLSEACQYCSQIDCPGHYGLMKFTTPIYNPAYIRDIVSVLTCVCNDCGGLLITEDVMKEKGFFKLGYDRRLKELEKYCKDHECIREKEPIGGGRIVPCNKNPVYITTEIKEKGQITYTKPEKGNKKPDKDATPYLMPIEKVFSILDRISPEDAELMGFTKFPTARKLPKDFVLNLVKRKPYQDLIKFGFPRDRSIDDMSYEEILDYLDNISTDTLRKWGFPSGTHPRDMILRGILVPPIIARPPDTQDGMIMHDQLTIMYSTIMKKVINIASGKATTTNELYGAIKQLMFKTEGKKMGTKDFLSIVERIQGKEALLRGFLMGKRNNYCGRTVAGPDPSLKFGQVRIPKTWAPVLTKAVSITDFNLNEMNKLAEEGKILYITRKGSVLRKVFDKQYDKLYVRDKVERWLQNGDRVVINRQPTLHKQSLMKYEVVLGDQSTIGLHLSYTTPMNCDFDGDENNMWALRDFEVEAEAEILMNVKDNTKSSEQNRPSMGFVMNSITGWWLATKDGTIIDDDLFNELMDLVIHKDNLLTLSQRLEKYGIHPRSGNALFSAILPSDFYYDQKRVVIKEGILISGRLKKAHVGTSHRSIIQELEKKYGSSRVSDFLTDGPWIINKWLMEVGFTVGMADMINLAKDEITGEEYDKSERIMKQELAKIYVKMEALGPPLDDPIEEMFRRRQINNYVNVTHGIGIRLANEALLPGNSIRDMTDLGGGAKGSSANIAQMFGAVGQQNYRGERLQPTLTNGTRLLPTFDPNSNDPTHHAFIEQSFYTGVSPEGLFFLQKGGREGLLDTAMKTAEIGNLNHKLVKSMENFVIAYDGSVRNTIGIMFSPMYNAGYFVDEMVAVQSIGKTDFSSFMDLKSVVAELNMKRGWVTASENAQILANRSKVNEQLKNFTENILPTSTSYIKGPTIQPVAYDINVRPTLQKSKVRITKFEKARIVGTRATQLSNNAPPLVDIGNEIDPIKIALKEYEAGVLKIYAIRKYPDGSSETIYPTLDNI